MKWALRRHPKKKRTWVNDRYWHNLRGRKWTFAVVYKGKKGHEDYLALKRLADVHYPRSTSKSRATQIRLTQSMTCTSKNAKRS